MSELFTREQALEWQKRPLEKPYPILYLDGIVFPVHQDGVITKKTVYLAYVITVTGHKDILGIWIGESESAKFRMHILSDIISRGVTDILIARVDGLTVFENYDFSKISDLPR